MGELLSNSTPPFPTYSLELAVKSLPGFPEQPPLLPAIWVALDPRVPGFGLILLERSAGNKVREAKQ